MHLTIAMSLVLVLSQAAGNPAFGDEPGGALAHSDRLAESSRGVPAEPDSPGCWKYYLGDDNGCLITNELCVFEVNLCRYTGFAYDSCEEHYERDCDGCPNDLNYCDSGGPS